MESNMVTTDDSDSEATSFDKSTAINTSAGGNNITAKKEVKIKSKEVNSRRHHQSRPSTSRSSSHYRNENLNWNNFGAALIKNNPLYETLRLFGKNKPEIKKGRKNKRRSPSTSSSSSSSSRSSSEEEKKKLQRKLKAAEKKIRKEKKKK